ncbi:hypothetical protein, partial [Haloferula sp.]|uniref:hypothetical protein n=1 Tax=Haloferula sp. TaxID=2497595 RepID=UPI003C74C332
MDIHVAEIFRAKLFPPTLPVKKKAGNKSEQPEIHASATLDNSTALDQSERPRSTKAGGRTNSQKSVRVRIE